MIDVLSVENMRKSDKHTIENKIPSKKLMLNAAQGIYNSYDWKGKILIACGTGNNGGDGYALATILVKNGHSPRVFMLDNPKTEDAKYYFDECKALGIEFLDTFDKEGYDVVVDCLLGTGFCGNIEGKLKEIIEKINMSGAYIISADINSGLNGDSGLGKNAIKSDLTVSIGSYKSGHYMGMAKDKIKRLTNADIGILPVDKPYKLVTKEDVSPLLFERENYTNKGTYGYMAIIGGCIEYSGAPRLAQMGACALRSGVGVVRLCVPKEIACVVSQTCLESTVLPLSTKKGGYLKFNKREIEKALFGTNSVCVGMGMGQNGDNEKILAYILENYEKNLLIDADGINTLAKMDKDILKKTKATVVLTPHIKELERLTQIPMDEILKNPISYAEKFAKEYGVILLLKGATTIVTDGENTYLIDTGCPGMATAGSGDVLSGIIGAFLATKEERTAIQSTYLGAYVNGYAGKLAQEEMGGISQLASDTAKSIVKAIKEIKGD